ncbi:ATP-grasp fold amidoligase family protein [Faecalibacterium sp. An192]|uniref:ATP-grasp fold amidoligase family protein n=1 Tax=Faecalibacterium sp. An192 TaxID=1965581 RepID=UPI000B391CEF|nr:ATP-grasp fold amidoligase family protein [Faecalibacterium sp. An192]OUP26452.1 glycosyltransferase [Faecalibacterium sp. An192]
MNNLLKNVILLPFNLLYKISPEWDLKILFFLKQHYALDLKNPKTYNEKLQWIKLYEKNPLMTKCCDKYAVREYVKQQGCEDILNHLIWQGFNPEEIPFSELPKKYVIKVTHGSTFNIIQNGELQITQNEIISRCRKWLKAKFLPCYGEWFYGVERPRVIVEDFIESADDTQLRDYKVFCFNGHPKMIRVDTDRFTNHKMDFFDCKWNRINNAGMGYEISGRAIEKPICINQVLDYAAKLSAPFKHARVDFYIVKDKIYFGEITFTNGAGFDRFASYDFDIMVGNWLNLD